MDEDTLIDFVIDHSHLSPDKLNNAIMDHLNYTIKGKPIDDITMLTLRIF